MIFGREGKITKSVQVLILEGGNSLIFPMQIILGRENKTLFCPMQLVGKEKKKNPNFTNAARGQAEREKKP